MARESSFGDAGWRNVVSGKDGSRTGVLAGIVGGSPGCDSSVDGRGRSGSHAQVESCCYSLDKVARNVDVAVQYPLYHVKSVFCVVVPYGGGVKEKRNTGTHVTRFLFVVCGGWRDVVVWRR